MDVSRLGEQLDFNRLYIVKANRCFASYRILSKPTASAKLVIKVATRNKTS